LAAGVTSHCEEELIAQLSEQAIFPSREEMLNGIIKRVKASRLRNSVPKIARNPSKRSSHEKSSTKSIGVITRRGNAVTWRKSRKLRAPLFVAGEIIASRITAFTRFARLIARLIKKEVACDAGRAVHPDE